MSLTTPLHMQPVTGDPAISYSALDVRDLVDALYGEEGALTVSDLQVTQRAVGANFSVDISAGRAVIQGDTVSDQGKYLVKSTAVENRVVPAPPATGTRIHRLVARVRDKLHDALETTYDWVLEVVEDVDGTGPPAVPDSAISRATVSVSAGQVSVTDDHITPTPANAVLRSIRPWQEYVPVAFTGSEAIELNDGAALGTFQQVGTTTQVAIQIVFDPTTNFHQNDGPLGVSLPVPAAVMPSLGSGINQLMMAQAWDRGLKFNLGLAQIQEGGGDRITEIRMVDGSPDGDMDNATRLIPWDWHGYELTIFGTYNAAEIV